MIIFCSDFFKEHVQGGAELTTDAIMEGSYLPVQKIMSHDVNFKILNDHSDCFWIFGNYHNLSHELQFYIAKNLNYAVVEYDYKYCKHRLPELHKKLEGNECDCHTNKTGKIAAIFLKKSKIAFWMSQKQLEHHYEIFPFLKNHNNIILSSVFSKKTIDYFKNFNKRERNENWGILQSGSWVKGTSQTIKYAKKKKLNFERLSGLEHRHFLRKLASIKGLVFHPAGRDTCPRITIEAKLLGCELDLNENVQHKDEDWFSSKEKIIEHLENRTDVFWKNVSKFVPELPKAETKENTHFKIIIPFYNVEDWIDKCIKSIKMQNYNNFECYLVDDMSTDKSNEIIDELIKEDSRFVKIKNRKKKFALHNIHNAIKKSKAKENDVIILLDGDDWLSCPTVLSKLDEIYEDRDCWLTYGSYLIYPIGLRGSEPSEYSKHVIENNKFREDEWRASHLRTFKHFLWKKLKTKDLKDEHGEFYEMTYDQAIMLPLLEMSGDRIRYVDHIMHVYNRANPLNIDKNKAQKQHSLALQIRKKTKYDKLEL
tara:strand:+ start:5516 stop:7132 length:1617 start_codon:yes stop_codon:yes gene_type:complete